MTAPKTKARRAAYMRAWRARRKEQGLPVDQRTPEGIATRREAQADYIRQYRRDRTARDPSWRPAKSVRSPEAHRAQEAIRRAIRAGVLVRPSTCAQCGATDVAIEAAHRDYSAPLDVRWLCRRCHRRWDAAEPKMRKP